eukprot:3254413-Rhodomonas_salina.2
MENDSCAPAATEAAEALPDPAVMERTSVQSVLGERDMVSKIVGMTGCVASMMAAQAVCRTWRDFIGADHPESSVMCRRAQLLCFLKTFQPVLSPLLHCLLCLV